MTSLPVLTSHESQYIAWLLTLLRDINQRNLGYFEQEVQKLDAWADAPKLCLDQQIKEVRHTVALSPTLEEKLLWQKKEGRRTKLRRKLFKIYRMKSKCSAIH